MLIRALWGLIVAVFFFGCAAKEHEKIVFKDVFIPVKCQEKKPVKPENNGSFEAHKQIMLYYLECENLLKRCVGE